MKLTKKIREQADEVRELSLDEARALPGLLGRIATAMLERHGWYGFNDVDSDRKVLLVLR